MTAFDLDSNGHPVIFAEPGTPSGSSGEGNTDDSTDVKSGDLPEAPLIPSTRPADINHVEWARRLDAVREAAREFEDLSDQDLRERLRGVTTKPLADTDVTAFRADVRAQQLDDLLDILDLGERGRLRRRRTVRIVAPNGYVRKTMNALTEEELRQLAGRLRARGWTDKQIKASLESKLPKKFANLAGSL